MFDLAVVLSTKLVNISLLNSIARDSQMAIFPGMPALMNLSPRTRQSEGPSYDAMTAMPKPEIKFSIDSILGLSSSRTSPVCEQTFGQDYNHNKNNDHDDMDDMDDDESIDVNDSLLEDNVHTECFSGDRTQLSGGEESIQYPWLQCTRYHPPKLQRSKKKEGHKKWKLGRNPRIPFTQHQLVVLEEKFRRTHYLSSMDVAELSSALNLTETRVKIWFQNRRARERRDKGGTQLQQSTVQKSFQPLTIPTVSWSVPTASNYVHYQQTLDFRSRYLVPSLGMYNTPEGNQVTEDCRDMKLHHLTDIQ